MKDPFASGTPAEPLSFEAWLEAFAGGWLAGPLRPDRLPDLRDQASVDPGEADAAARGAAALLQSVPDGAPEGLRGVRDPEAQAAAALALDLRTRQLLLHWASVILAARQKGTPVSIPALAAAREQAWAVGRALGTDPPPPLGPLASRRIESTLARVDGALPPPPGSAPRPPGDPAPLSAAVRAGALPESVRARSHEVQGGGRLEITAPYPAVVRAPGRPRDRRRRALFALAVALCAGAAYWGWVYASSRPPPPAPLAAYQAVVPAVLATRMEGNTLVVTVSAGWLDGDPGARTDPILALMDASGGEAWSRFEVRADDGRTVATFDNAEGLTWGAGLDPAAARTPAAPAAAVPTEAPPAP